MVRGITVQVRNSLALPERAATAAKLLCNLNAAFGELFADENFVTLLRAESLTTIPSYLRQVFDEAKSRHEVA
jgi:ParB family chromosome partitioning protein